MNIDRFAPRLYFGASTVKARQVAAFLCREICRWHLCQVGGKNRRNKQSNRLVLVANSLVLKSRTDVVITLYKFVLPYKLNHVRLLSKRMHLQLLLYK